MKIAYLLLVHDDPKQVGRLAMRLSAPGNLIFVHVDRGKKQAEFEHHLSGIPRTRLLAEDQRIASIWGDFGIVQASVNLLRAAYGTPDVQWFVLLSGQDYPLVSNLKIAQFLHSNPDTAFIECGPAQKYWPPTSLNARLRHYKFNISYNRGDLVTIADCWSKDFYTRSTFLKIKSVLKTDRSRQILRLLRRRKFPFNGENVFGGSAWWALPRAIAKPLLDLIGNTPGIDNYFRSSLLPDELYFQNCLMHLAVSNPRILIRDSLTYVNWTRKHVPLPVTFTVADQCELHEAQRTHFFARKFNSDLSGRLLDWLDRSSLPQSELRPTHLTD